VFVGGGVFPFSKNENLLPNDSNNAPASGRENVRVGERMRENVGVEERMSENVRVGQRV